MALEIGKCYLFETCTKNWVGRLVTIDGPYAVTIEEAAWIAESGRFHVFLRDGAADGMEIEPVPDGPMGLVWVNWIVWSHKLFRKTV